MVRFTPLTASATASRTADLPPPVDLSSLVILYSIYVEDMYVVVCDFERSEFLSLISGETEKRHNGEVHASNCKRNRIANSGFTTPSRS
mmetsp:Transcript_158/g.200  ORF Transcript_158/g.200 Transcript_158/m.200 type:complete len:89 (-) Transcript_158:41-307(-)